MCNQQTLTGTTGATSSQESAGGNSRSISPGGLHLFPFGQGPAPANPSQSQERGEEPRTSGTSGLSSSASSASADLQSSLASRLRRRLGSGGSMEYSLTWKVRVTPAQRQICALRASASRTSGSGCTGALSGWMTPKLPSGGGQQVGVTPGGGLRKLEDQAERLAGWRTPNESKGGGAFSDPERIAESVARGHMLELGDQVVLVAGWPTPRAEDSEQTGAHRGVPDTLTSATRLAGWATPRTGKVSDENPKTWQKRHDTGDVATMPLTLQAQMCGWTTPSAHVPDPHRTGTSTPSATDGCTLVGWATPSTRDYKDTPGMATTGVNPDGSERTRLDQLPRQAAQAPVGETPTSSTAETASGAGYRLNPMFVARLMGFPGWHALAGMLLVLPKRPRGSKR